MTSFSRPGDMKEIQNIKMLDLGWFGHMRSLEMSLFDTAHMTLCSPLIETMPLSCTEWVICRKLHIFKIFLYWGEGRAREARGRTGRDKNGTFIFENVFALMQSCVVHSMFSDGRSILRPPYGIGQAIIFLPCGFSVLLSFYLFSLPNLSGWRLDVYHTSTHGVALLRI